MPDLCSSPPPQPLSTLPCPAIRPGSHQHASRLLVSGWSHSMGSTSRRWGQREEWGHRIYFPGLLPAGLLPGDRVLCLKVWQPLSVSGFWCSCLFRPSAVAVATVPGPREPHYPFWSSHFLLTPLSIVFLLNSPQITHFEHIICFLLDYGWCEVTYNKVGETLMQRRSTSVPKRSLWSSKPSRYPEEAMVRGLPSSSLLSIPSLVPRTSFQLLF